MVAPTKENTREELIEIIRSTPGHGRQYEIAKTLLEMKTQEENVELQSKMIKQSKQLNRATWILAFATIALVASTVGLIVVTVQK